MAVPKTIAAAVGSWSGESALHTPWMPEGKKVNEGPSKLHVDLARDQSYAVVSYTWTYEGKQEEGHMIVSSGKSQTNIGWSDTWHQNSAVMLLSGPAADNVSCKGTYKVAGHPDWGWRIAIEMDGDSLTVQMFNVTPEGQEEWAVRGRYKKE